jgi:hypothetical protein
MVRLPLGSSLVARLLAANGKNVLQPFAAAWSRRVSALGLQRLPDRSRLPAHRPRAGALTDAPDLGHDALEDLVLHLEQPLVGLVGTQRRQDLGGRLGDVDVGLLDEPLV